jgi:hypothetical protein
LTLAAHGTFFAHCPSIVIVAGARLSGAIGGDLHGENEIEVRPQEQRGPPQEEFSEAWTCSSCPQDRWAKDRRAQNQWAQGWSTQSWCAQG